MTNKYPGYCSICGVKVARNAGIIKKQYGRWTVRHLSCNSSGQAEVSVTRFSSGAEVYRNRNGLCEDAPCCGCCS